MKADVMKRLILAAGGTGGHIWPALSFGMWVSENHPECAVRYMCGARRLELDIYKAAGVDPFVLPIEGSPLSGDVAEKFKRFGCMVSAFQKARKGVDSFKPDAALLFGGYLSFPVMLSCKKYKVRCLIHEQNVYAGRVTRFASKNGILVLSGWNECVPIKKNRYKYVGIPVRNFDIIERAAAWRDLGLGECVPTGRIAVVFTGSLGSVSVKNIICKIAESEMLREWTFVLPAVTEMPERPSDNVILLPRVWNTSLLYSLADVLVVRAGGSTLAEARELGIPAVVIPCSRATDNHQLKNAQLFVKENNGIMLKEDEMESRLADVLSGIGEKSGTKCVSPYNHREAVCSRLWDEIWNCRECK
ncbi:MAG: UDP-N-acetylglucosamine--N-acetylmuramyl-(pentapeptide) pyrophosphoryl-undecaprenol N-acetylglucosamine transferase [Synergistes sp.]|nr:UDP-N-acetylglucosamine--N-acetylmuramyl-(pentapeptide) pyrophosphoryl-undecaprenol N-acetylglucosamine transferase [Synergistes sp.]